MINILHMYYDLLNLYGEEGNIKALSHYLTKENINFNIDYKTMKDEIDFTKYDLIYLGSGSNDNLDLALSDILRHKESLKKFIDDNKYLISTGNSYLLFGKMINDKPALGLFNYRARKSNKKALECFMEYKDLSPIIGFQNRSYDVFNEENHLFKVISGLGDNDNSCYEGYKYNNFYGTFTFGPLLIRNPKLTKEIIKDILNKKDIEFTDSNDYLDEAYNEYLNNFYQNKSC